MNPVRAGLVASDQPLSSFAWSSYPLYLSPRRRPAWRRVDRLLGEHGIREDSAKGRIQFRQRMEQPRTEGEAPEMLAVLRRGWRLGASDFLHRLTEKLGRRGQPHELASQRGETDQGWAERLVRDGLQERGWTEEDLRREGKAHPHKVELARRLRRETPMTRQWIAGRLGMGSASYVSHVRRGRPREDGRGG